MLIYCIGVSLSGLLHSVWASLMVQLVKNPPAMWETWVWSLGWGDPLEKGRVTHSSVLAWRIPWTIQSMESQRLGHDTLYNRSSFIHLIRTDSNLFIFIAEYYSIVYLYHSFLIHSSVDRHLGCFHVLAIVNSAVLNIGVHVSLSILVSLCVCPAVGLLGHMAVLFPVL